MGFMGLYHTSIPQKLISSFFSHTTPITTTHEAFMQCIEPGPGTCHVLKA